MVQQVQDSCFITANGCLDAEGCLQLKEAIANAKAYQIKQILVNCGQLTAVTQRPCGWCSHRPAAQKWPELI
jgi:anti-anti-sigma regulatory factor